MIEEWIQNLDATAYENNLYKYEKLLSIKKKSYRNDKTDYCPKSITESLNWLPLIDIMEFTAERIYNDKILLPALLRIISMYKIKCWWNPR